MSRGYIYDQKNVGFRRKRSSVWRILRKVIIFFVLTILLTVIYYTLFALFFDTKEEKAINREIAQYENNLPEINRRSSLISDVIEGLRLRDDDIYVELFKTSPPGLTTFNASANNVDYGKMEEAGLVGMVEDGLNALESRLATIERNFKTIMDSLQSPTLVMPPMHSPLEDFSYAQVGASVGNKINPFYKVQVAHNGLDIIAHSGEPVYAVADGVVQDVVESRKGMGNQVTLNHGNGYVTNYAHLSDISVKKGRTVTKGTILGYVGVSGNSYAPHLHYEVRRDTLILDPVNHFFGSVSAEDFIKMKTMSVNTQQSLD